MMHGLKLRAEGGSEPPWIEIVEIGCWLMALICGLAAAGIFVLRRQWQRPLAVAGAAVVVLFVLTFVQPPIWQRILLDMALLVGVWWSVSGTSLRSSGAAWQSAPAPR
jgi:hypothetical protein